MAALFISYRRSDCQPHANGLYDGLLNRLPEADVFLDTDSLDAGSAWEEAISKAIERSDVVLVVIGDNWLDKGPDDTRRLDKPGDHVRREVELALQSNAAVIPVLVEGATVPERDDLPESIARLTAATATRLDDDRWRSDVDNLAVQIARITGGKATRQTEGDEGFALPSRVTGAWLERTVPTLSTDELEALGMALQKRRGWTRGEVINTVFVLANATAQPKPGRIGNASDAPRFEPPNRITYGWLEDSVPDLTQNEAEALAECMRRRGWSEGDIEDWVYAVLR